MIEKKIMYGLQNIHVAKLTPNGYETPIPIEGAKNVDAELNFNVEVMKKGKGNIRFTEFKGGSGTLEVIGLTPYEYELLFGSTVKDNRVTVKETDISTPFALMFSRTNMQDEEVGYCIYKVIFKHPGILGSTITNGIATEETIQIDFDIESNDGDIYYFDKCNYDFFYKIN